VSGQTDGRVDDMKWWRWDPYVSRWMPSEPPQGPVDTAQWCLSDAVPAASGPSGGGDHNLRSTGSSWKGMGVSDSSSWPFAAAPGPLGHLKLLPERGPPASRRGHNDRGTGPTIQTGPS